MLDFHEDLARLERGLLRHLGRLHLEGLVIDVRLWALCQDDAFVSRHGEL